MNHAIENLAQLFFGYDMFGDIYDSLKTIVNLNQSTLNIDNIIKEYIQIKENFGFKLEETLPQFL